MSAIIIIQVRRSVDAEGVRYYELNKSEEQYQKCKLLLDNILSSPGTRLTIIIILPHVFIILMPGRMLANLLPSSSTFVDLISSRSAS